MKKRHEPAIERHQILVAAFTSQAEQCLALLWESVRHARDPPDSPHENALDNYIVETGKYDEAIADAVSHIGESAGIPRGILERDDVLAIREVRQNGR